ncbi:MAG: hypothetical protein J3R72DRAFT_464975 [Linnemannia gamsii]|nr:MAG: hypothetical protein J3R72DRAFT_464975 [Linnemannia gamsii]
MNERKKARDKRERVCHSHPFPLYQSNTIQLRPVLLFLLSLFLPFHTFFFLVHVLVLVLVTCTFRTHIYTLLHTHTHTHTSTLHKDATLFPFLSAFLSFCIFSCSCSCSCSSSSV